MLAQIKSYGTLALLAWAVAGPLLTYGWTALAAYLEKREAVSKAQAAAKSACDARVTEIQTQLNNAVVENQRLAAEAEASVAPTPADMAERQALCNRSASCRSRNKEVVR